jgi:hypothetical protein
MASYQEARAAKLQVSRTLSRLIGRDLVGVGISGSSKKGYGLRVILPGEPRVPVPAQVDGIDIDYDIAEAPPELLAEKHGRW